MRAMKGVHTKAGFLLLTGAVSARAGAAEGGGEEVSLGLWPLFMQSFDVFTVLLLAGSLVAVALIVRCVIDIRTEKILPSKSVSRIRSLVREGETEALAKYVRRDGSFVAVVVDAALQAPGRTGEAVREAAEMAASDQCARLFRKIELLNVLGNLGPLVGLAGTVWGMILAFTSLGAAGGQAGPAELSLGLSKALFHTLGGLCLAIPCLLFFGIYRSVVDRICTQGMTISGDVVERLLLDQAAPRDKPRRSEGG